VDQGGGTPQCENDPAGRSVEIMSGAPRKGSRLLMDFRAFCLPSGPWDITNGPPVLGAGICRIAFDRERSPF
jgi:hypothetical protein